MRHFPNQQPQRLAGLHVCISPQPRHITGRELFAVAIVVFCGGLVLGFILGNWHAQRTDVAEVEALNRALGVSAP